MTISTIIKPFLLLLLISAFLNSCSQEELDGKDLNELGINTSQNREAVMNFINDKSTLRETYNARYSEIFESRNVNRSSSSEAVDVAFKEELIAEYNECSSCYNDHKEQLIPLLEELFEAENNEVLSLIDSFTSEIKQASLDDNTKSDLLFIAFTFKAGAEASLAEINSMSARAGFWDCFRKNSGKNVGEGIGYGFLGGCLLGGVTGALGGTVLLPGVGTFGGAVAGCVIGGAEGAVVGAVFGVVKTGLTCLFS